MDVGSIKLLSFIRWSWTLPGGWTLFKKLSIATVTTSWCPGSKMSWQPTTSSQSISSPWPTSKPFCTEKVWNIFNEQLMILLDIPQVSWCRRSGVSTHHKTGRANEIPEDCSNCSEETRRTRFPKSDQRSYNLSPQTESTASQQVRKGNWISFALKQINYTFFSSLFGFSCVFCKADELFTDYESKLFSQT